MNAKYKICILLLMCVILTTHAQDVSTFENVEAVTEKGFFKKHFKGLFKDLKSGTPLTISGGAGLSMRTYNAWGLDELRQPPYFWVVNANLNIGFYKINIPVSAILSLDQRELITPTPPGVPNIKERYTNRFNRFGMSPYYKWIKLHLGHRNMTFSKFTLNNITFFGSGVELTPGKIRLAAMSGRLAEAKPQDLSLTEPNLPIFKRRGYGLKVGYGSSSNFLDLMFFKGWDDNNSIPITNPQEVFPNENLVVGINAQTTFFEKFTLRVDAASSALSPNMNETSTGDKQFPFPQFLIEQKQNTLHKDALETGIDYKGKGFTLGANYRRIEPGYKTLGAYFFNNDIEDITGRASWSILEKKLQFNVSAGVQSDNLDNSKNTTLTRLIGSANINYAAEKFNLGLNYSNYSSDIAYVLDEELDSLNVVVVTQDFGVNATYTLAAKEGYTQTLTATANLQNVTDDIANTEQSGESQMLNANLIYAINLTEAKLRLSANTNYNQNKLAMATTSRWGAGLGVNKTLLENKLNLGFNVNYFNARIQSLANLSNKTTNVRFTAAYAVNQRHSLRFNYMILRRNKEGNNTSDIFTEGIGNLGYQYNFSWQPLKKKEKKKVAEEKEK